jgi:hypothetical protein
MFKHFFQHCFIGRPLSLHSIVSEDAGIESRTVATLALAQVLKGAKLEIFGSRVFIQIRPVDGLSLKIAILYFMELSPTSLKFLSAVGEGVKNLKR